VLSRYIEVLEDSPHDYFVRITGDCPLIDPEFIDKQILALQSHDADLVWLDPSVSVLEGQSVHSTRSLQLIASKSQHQDDLEHVGSRYLAEHPDAFCIIGMHPPEYLANIDWRITVDEPKDYDMMIHLYEHLWEGEQIPLEAVLMWSDQNPDLAKKNNSVVHSIINQDLAAKRKSWKQHIDFYCDWHNPQLIIG